MINRIELKHIEDVIDTETDSLELMKKLMISVNEPQLRSELETIISSHRNHISKIISLLENNYGNK